MLATLSIAFTNMAESSSVLPPADQQRVADVLEDDAQVMSDAQLGELLAGQPEAVQHEILSINTDARDLALQVALLVSLLAAFVGVAIAFRMMRLPDPAQSAAARTWGSADTCPVPAATLGAGQDPHTLVKDALLLRERNALQRTLMPLIVAWRHGAGEPPLVLETPFGLAGAHVRSWPKSGRRSLTPRWSPCLTGFSVFL